MNFKEWLKFTEVGTTVSGGGGTSTGDIAGFKRAVIGGPVRRAWANDRMCSSCGNTIKQGEAMCSRCTTEMECTDSCDCHKKTKPEKMCKPCRDKFKKK